VCGDAVEAHARQPTFTSEDEASLRTSSASSSDRPESTGGTRLATPNGGHALEVSASAPDLRVLALLGRARRRLEVGAQGQQLRSAEDVRAFIRGGMSEAGEPSERQVAEREGLEVVRAAVLDGEALVAASLPDPRRVGLAGALDPVDCACGQRPPDAECDACEGCLDVCSNDGCKLCASKRVQLENERRDRMSICQVQRRIQQGDCLLVGQGHVVDASEWAPRHPAGAITLLRGLGRDAGEDMEFHSKSARRLWQKHRIAALVRCACAGYGFAKPPKSTCIVS